MKKIWEFFENLNEFVYVSDIDSYELVYMNKKTRENYGIHSEDEYVGKKCYELLQKNSSPCAICNNHELKEGQFKEWCYFNPLVGKHMSLKDTMVESNGRRYRIELAFDVSLQERQGRALRGHENLENIANEGMRVALQAPTPDKSLEVILEYLGKALKGDRTYIFEKNATGGDDNTYEWVANGVSPEIDNLKNLSPEVCANWYRSFREDKNIIIENIEDIREEDPLQYENLKRQKIHSLAVVPLFFDGTIIGFYGIDNPPRGFVDYAQNMFQIVGHFIVSCLRRRNLVNELRNMSYRDQLTGLGNRHALYEYIQELSTGENVGIVYGDINGLKQVNDTKGHKAGDELIVHACESLKRAFSDDGLFRIGGDELLVLCSGIQEDVFMKKVEMLRADLRKCDIVISIGIDYKKAEKDNMENLLAQAEKRMYEDKREYYRTQGIDRRK